MKKNVIRVVLLILVAGGAAAWWYDLPGRLGWKEQPGEELTLYGNVDIRQVQLGFRVSGRLVEMKVDEGDKVEAGAILARLDAQPYDDLVEAARAQVAAQQATHAKLEAGPRVAEIAQARAVLAERSADLANAEQALERARQLRPGGAISQAVLDQAQATRDAAMARQTAAREALTLLEEGTRVEDLAVARANLQAARANLSSARTSLEDTYLRAPADGVILSRVREPGAITAPNDVIYIVSLSEPMWVRAYIAEPYLGTIRPGMEVEVFTDSAPAKPYRGTVGFISPVAEFTPKSVETPELRTDLVYRLRVTVSEPDDGLRQGMPVTIRIPLRPRVIASRS